MRIIHFTPGTGSFFCGSCLRDHAAMKWMRTLGHDVVMVPLYLPLVLDEDGGENVPLAPLFLGGVNMYLQQKFRFFRRTPAWIDRWFDRRGLLLAAAKRAGMTRARDLGELAVSTLRGTEGHQRKELEKLLAWLREQDRPDLVSFSNGLLTGLAAAVREEFSVPVVCSLQGEDSFLEALPEPYRSESWDLFRRNSEGISRYIAVSEFYAEVMRRHLRLAPGRITPVLNGADLSSFRDSEPGEPPVIGYLARMCHGKGLETLVDAYLELRRRRPQRVLLHVAGAMTAVDEPLVAKQRSKLKRAGWLDDVEFFPNVTHEEKLEFFRRLSLFSVPAHYGEAFGLFVVEALASGVPVVQPEHGAFPEVLARSGGGLLCRPNDPADLAAKWIQLLDRPEEARKLGREGQAGVRAYFTAERMTGDLLRVFEEALRGEQEASRNMAVAS